MAKPKRKKAGRPRKSGAVRTPSGQISRAGQSAIPEAALERIRRMIPESALRAEMARTGRSVEAILRTERTPLAILRLRGDITQQQQDAGEKIGKLWRRWSAAAGAPPRSPVITESSLLAADMSEEQWQRLKRDMEGAWEAIGCLPQYRLVYAMIECVCVEEVMPLRLAPDDHMRPRMLEALRDGLATMVVFFRIGRKDAA